MNFRRVAGAIAITCAVCSSVNAGDLANIDRLNQSQFRLLAQDVGATFSIKGFAAGTSFGLPGVDVSVGVGASDIGHRSVWDQAWKDGDAPNYLPISTWQARVDVSDTVDIAGQYVIAHRTDLRMIGGEVRWGFIPQALLRPGLTLGVSYSRLTGNDDLSFDAVGLTLTASKDFAVVTPYAGVGRVWSRTKALNVASLSAESVQQNRIFAGIRLNLLLNLVIEADRTGDSTNYGIKYGLYF